jgi:FtsH-binding integral membrane protein
MEDTMTARTLDSKTMSRVFGKMTIAMLVSAVTAGIMAFYGLTLNIFATLIGLMIIVVLNMVLGTKIKTMNPMALYAMLGFESLYMGALIGGVVQQYSSAAVMVSFIVAATYFIVLMLIGLTTKKDLTKIGTLSGVALIVLIIVEVIMMFFNVPVLWMIASGISLIIFAGLTAYDAQKLKLIEYDGSVSAENMTTMIALNLYLDFVNIFMNLLQLLGGGSRN